MRQHVNVIVDGMSIRDGDGLETRLRDGAEVLLIPAVSGGLG